MDNDIIIVEIFVTKERINLFDTDTLFMNIYYYWHCYHLLSFHWKSKALIKLKRNIIKKWPLNDFCVNLFLKLVSMKDQNIDPTNYFFKSEDYFEHLIQQKRWSEVVCKNNKKRKSRKSRKSRKCIR